MVNHKTLAALTGLGLALLTAGLQSLAAPPAATPADAANATPLEAARGMIQRRDFAKARTVLLFELYRKPADVEEECLLAQVWEGLVKKDDAIALYAMCVRSLEELGPKPEPRLAAIGKDAAARLARLDQGGPRQRKAYLDSAASKPFIAPEKVSDLWMTQVTATKLPYDMLERPGACVLDAFKKGWTFDHATGTMVKPAPGGEKPHQSPMKLTGPQDFPRRHISGAGYVEEAGGRKGILNLHPNWRTKEPSQLKMRNVGKCDFLRIGASSPVWSTPNCEVAASQDKADFVLNVYVGEKRMFSEIVGGRKWTDLKIDLGEFRGKDVEVIVEDAAGGNEPYVNGAYFDYVDFFKD